MPDPVNPNPIIPPLAGEPAPVIVPPQDPAPDVPVQVVPVELPVQVTPVVPTQVSNPGKATLRTFIQAALGGIITFLAIWPLLSPILSDTLDDYIDPAKVIASIAAVSAIAAAISRIMAIPVVNDWLGKIGLGAAKKQ